MSKELNGQQLLVGKSWFGIIAQTLKTSFGRRILGLTDKQVDLNQLIFHKQENLSKSSVCLSFNY